MKKAITLLTVLVLSLTICSCSQDLKKVNERAADKDKITIAETFANSFFERHMAGSYYEFSTNATDAVKAQLTEQNQRAVYRQITDQFGIAESIAYTETWTQQSNTNYHIIRMKGKFSKSSKHLEVRVVIDNQNLISGFWIMPWSDML